MAHTTNSNFCHLLAQLVGPSKTLSQKLAAVPFASSLQSAPTLEQFSERLLHLQRISEIAVLDATRDKKHQLIMTLKVSLRPQVLQQQVGIFVPNNAPLTLEIKRSFEQVNQLKKLLAFCVSSRADDDHDQQHQDCEFCSELMTYLSNHYIKEPLVAIGLGGHTAIRKGVLAKFLAQLSVFAIGQGSVSPQISTDKCGVMTHANPNAAVVNPTKTELQKNGAVCAAQRDVVSVLFDFFDLAV